MRFNEDSYIQKLMVLGSSVCNLGCSYCYLHDQHKNNAYVLLNKEIQRAWKDGSYVENIKKVFKEIGSDPKIVTDIEIWGGEPLIMTKNLITPIEELIEYFPNVGGMNIPTNFTRVNDLGDFARAIDKTKKKIGWNLEENGKLKLHIQLSIDAPPGPMQDAGHNINWDVYRKNIELLCQDIASGPPLEFVEIDIEKHATIPFDLITTYLTTVEDLKAYIDYFNEFHNYIMKTIMKYNLGDQVCDGSETLFPHTAQPAEVSIEESLCLYDSLYLLNYIEHHIDYGLDGDQRIYTNNGFATGNRALLRTNPVCLESGLMAITVMYDGSICECPCDYILNFDKFWDWIKDNPLKRKFYRENMIKKQFYINPLTASQKEKDDFDWYVYDSVRLNTSTALHLMMNFVLELAKSGQIEYTYYKDPDRLLKDLTQFNQEYSCPRDQLATTMNPYTCDQHVIRRYFNGLARMAQTDYRDDVKFEAKGLYKWNYIGKSSTEEKKTVN